MENQMENREMLARPRIMDAEFVGKELFTAACMLSEIMDDHEGEFDEEIWNDFKKAKKHMERVAGMLKTLATFSCGYVRGNMNVN